MKWSLLAVILMVGCASVAQNSSRIMRVEFSSLTRGYQEKAVFTSDSMKYTRTQVGQPKIDEVKALKKNDWQEILKALEKVNLSEVPDLKSPTMKRAFDGAKHSTLTIITDSNQSFIHSFDDENPHEKLKALMSTIVKKRGK